MTPMNISMSLEQVQKRIQINISTIGNLQIQLEDDTIVKYGLKEISFAKV